MMISPCSLFCCIIVLLIDLKATVNGSAGDSDISFYRCVMKCVNTPPLTDTQALDKLFPPKAAWQIVRWDAQEMCEYQCMREITALRQQRGWRVLQYFGHWPFDRWFGLEEPASVVFSALNAVSHIAFLFRGGIPADKDLHGMRVYLSPYAVLAINAWVASALFHSKKTDTHTTYDYVSALGFIVAGFLLVCQRCKVTLLTITLTQQRVWWIHTLFHTINAVTLCFTLWRMYFMLMFPFRVYFDQHMKLCIALIALTTTLWCVWVAHGLYMNWKENKSDITVQSFNDQDVSTEMKMDTKIEDGCEKYEDERRKDRRTVYFLCLLTQLWLVMAAALEVGDFPPFVGLFDAHALWHAATVPLGFVWYKFWCMDAISCEIPCAIKTKDL